MNKQAGVIIPVGFADHRHANIAVQTRRIDSRCNLVDSHANGGGGIGLNGAMNYA